MDCQKEIDQDRLKEQLAAGDELAFSDFYNRYWEPLFKYVMRILASEDETADVVQEAFITFWRQRNKLADITSLKAYLFVIARNLAFKQLQKSLRKQDVLEKFLAFYGEADDYTEQQVNANDLSLVIDQEIARLPEKMRQIFIMSRKENLSYNEIAERLEISDLTVKKQVSNALKYLRLRMVDDLPYLIVFFLIGSL